MDTPWWLRLPSRLLDEEAAIQKLYAEEAPFLVSHDWSKGDDGTPRLLARVRVLSGEQDLEVRFPPHYPDGCPSVRPVPYDTRVSTHQFVVSGILCLELGPDNWHPDHTAADLLFSAHRLAVYERINAVVPIDIPSRHSSSLADRVRFGAQVLLRPIEFDLRVGDASEHVEFEAAWVAPHYGQVVPLSFPKDSPLQLPPALTGNASPFAARLVRLQDGVPLSDTVTLDLASFSDFVETYAGVLLDETTSLVLLRWPDGSTRSYWRGSATFYKLEDVVLDALGAVRVPGLLQQRLSQLSIGIVGLGSLGSKVATSLVRTGLQRLVLVDGDVMQGQNVCRHQGTYRDVAVMKVEVVRRIIRDICSVEPAVTTYPIEIGAATNPEYHARMLEDLSRCDIVVDATANPEAFTLLAGLASNHGRSLVWAEVFGGGLGGLVGSAHPDLGPCPRCVRAGFLSAAAAWPPAPHTRAREAYDGGEDGALIATDADVSFVASACLTRINDLIVPGAFAPPSVIVLGIRRGWIFDTAMQTVAVHVRTDDWSCDRCWRRAEEPDPAAVAAVEALLAGQVDAQDSPSA